MTAGATWWAAVCCAAAAAWSVFGPPAAVVRLRDHDRAPSADRPEERARAVRPAGPGRTARDGRPDPMSGGLRPAGLLGLIAAAVRAPVERRRQTALWRTAVISLCDGIGAELAAGRTPEAALAEAVVVVDPAVAAVLRAGPPEADASWPLGVDVPGLLERTAVRPGGEGLRLLAACWRIGAERGGTLASVVDGLATTLRQDEAHRQEITAQLAGPRATARLLAGLPVLGLAMAAALGAHPVAFLFGTFPGAMCLVLGIGLDLLGLMWTRRLADRAETPVGRRVAAAGRSRE